MVLKNNLPYKGIEKKMVTKIFGSDSHLFDLPPGVKEILDNNRTLPYFITVTIDDNGCKTIIANQPNAPKN